jgi:O-antigen/teichoic acid export membrane protein
VEPGEARVEGLGLRRYAVNTAWLLVAQVAGKAASFVFVVIVARSLGARDFGYFSFALAFVPLFLVAGGWGLESAVIREVARDRQRLSEIFATGLALRASLGFAGLAIAFASAPLFLDGWDAYVVVALVGAALFLNELSDLVGAVFQGFERMQFHAFVVLANRVLSTTLAVVAVVLDAGVVAVSLAYLAGSAGAFAFSMLALLRRFPPIDYRRMRRSVARGLLSTGIPLGVAGALNTAVFRIDTVMVQAFRGAVEVGLYSAAYRFFESLLFVSWSLGNVALPRMARQKSWQARAQTYELTIVLSLAFYLPLALTLPFASEWLITTLFSQSFEEASAAVGALTGAALLYAVALVGRMGLIALGRTKAVAVVAGVVLAANVTINLVAIPRYGFEGAAWAMLATEVIEAALLTALFVRANGIAIRLRTVLVPILATSALAAAVVSYGLEGPQALLALALGYPPALLLSAALLAPNELRRLPAAMRRTQPTPG